MKREINRVLHNLRDDSEVEKIRSVSGGDINEAFYVRTGSREYFIKGNRNVPPHFFKAEAAGLQMIQKSNTIAVPDVFYYDEPQSNEPGFLVLEWIEGRKKSDTGQKLGTNLALMHQHTSNAHGFGEPTFVGELDQPNDWQNSWIEYYRNFRLRNQLQIGVENGNIKGKRKQQLEMLIQQLERWVPDVSSPSLLHGDLWGGNYIAGPEGEPYLIDPSVLYGDPSFEIAFTELFGGFPEEFYDAYQEVSPLPEYYEEIKPLYQLFYLLVHLNIFGESYGPSVDRILHHYIT
ncbi:fructosamine kinase family protein [Halobacillus campisalis]|uniref:Fructosamine kinase family protein n=1 Tax=Halobacillus campisalis TaxID=435909 RepID=A0ABW2K0B6_9BACI|nr:fructosamine kinase family protein [Halobacillus campisalis]